MKIPRNVKWMLVLVVFAGLVILIANPWDEGDYGLAAGNTRVTAVTNVVTNVTNVIVK